MKKTVTLYSAKRAITLFAVMLLAFICVNANPVRPGQWLTITTQDGVTLRATPVGDEHGHYLLGEDGQAYNKAQGADYYVAVDAQQINESAQARRAAANANRAAQRRVGTFPVGGVKGAKKSLVILVNFQDRQLGAGHTQALYNRIFNEKNFSMQVGDGYYDRFIGSLYDYFYAQSYGQFELTFDVVGPVTVSHNYAYYGGNYSGLSHEQGGRDMHSSEMALEAVQMADEFVNFRDYDWDGDGNVEQVYIIYAGYGESDNMNDPDAIWPHQGWLPETLTRDGVKLSVYACSNELQYDNSIAGIGTIAHEFSHCLGLPDFYDTSYGNGDGMNANYDLMDGGSSLGKGYWPCAYTGYERWMFGWKEPIELTESDDKDVTGVQPISSGGNFYVMYNPADKNQYFMMENRSRTGWDLGLPCTGLMIYRVLYDETAWTSNQVNANSDLQRMLVMNAGNYKAGYADGVLYPFEGNAFLGDPANNSFGPTTLPAAVFPTDGSAAKRYSGEVSNIVKSGNEISFHYKGTNDLAAAFKRTTTVETGKSYLIVAPLNGKLWAAKAIDASKWYDYIYPIEVEDNDGIIKTEATDIIYSLQNAGNGNFYLLDSNGRYIYQTKKSSGAWNFNFNVNTYVSDDVKPFSFVLQSDGTFKIMNPESQCYFQCTLYDNAPEFGIWDQERSNRFLPYLYEKVTGSTGIRATTAVPAQPANVRKAIEGGRLIIIGIDGKKYTIEGVEVK